MKQSLVFINSHPIQYFAPLYQAIANDGAFELEVWYCSKHGLEGEIDKQFNSPVKWDIPLLEGYRSKFLKNNSWKPGIYLGFWGLINLEIIKKLWQKPKSLVVVHGWNSLTNILAIIIARIFGHKVAIRGETPITLELEKSPSSLILRKIIFSFFFPWINYFLYIGTNNLKFYQFYKVAGSRLIFTPYSVDNARFKLSADSLQSQRQYHRLNKGLKEHVLYVLYSGKYIDKKHPLDLLKAINTLQKSGKQIGAIFMGEGNLREKMEKYINEKQLKNIILTGFVNQSEVSTYYSISDIFVMCSDAGETWGLSANEAMNFGLPILAYDSVGCAIDLVRAGQNGFIVPKGNIVALEERIAAISENAERRYQMGQSSVTIIENYSFNNIIAGLKKIPNVA